MGIVRAIILYIVWNAIFATFNMWATLKTEYWIGFWFIFFLYSNHKNTTVARHFATHGETYSAPLTIHILEYIKVSKDKPKSKSLRNKRELTWIHRLNTLIPNGLNTIDNDVAPKKSKKASKKWYSACCITLSNTMT